ncbi:hypothetical protein [Bradyrhizobium sp.]
MVAYSFKKQFVNPIRVGLGQYPVFQIGNTEVSDMEIPITPKRQTIRALGKRRHARPGEVLQLYHGMRTKQCMSIGVARCTSVEGVLLKWSEWQSFALFDIIELDRPRRYGPLKPIEDMEAFAASDGFGSFNEMKSFWAAEHGLSTFEGLLIRWEPIR